MFAFLPIKKKVEEPKAQQLAYFCDMCGQTHALFATLKNSEEHTPTVYRISSVPERRGNMFVSVVEKSEKFQIKDLLFFDETGQPVDIRRRHAQNGLFFFHTEAE